MKKKSVRKVSSVMKDVLLPATRVHNATIFEVVGIDLAGPLYLKDMTKTWAVLSTCALYRCVHLELVIPLSTEYFLMAPERFTKRRGRPSTIFNDNGTNFVGSNIFFKKIDWERDSNDGRVKRIEWNFIPPTAAWWEAVINERPMTYVSDDSNDVVTISPSMFLPEQTDVEVPECQNMGPNPTTQKLRYLGEVGDVVLVGMDNKKRNFWPLAVVEEILFGRDGVNSLVKQLFLRLLNDKEKTANIQTLSGRTVCMPNRLDDYYFFSYCVSRIKQVEEMWNNGDPLRDVGQTDWSNDTTEPSVPKQEKTFEEEDTSPPQGTSADPLTQIPDALSMLLVAPISEGYKLTLLPASAVYQRQVEKAPHPIYHNPPPRYNNQRSSPGVTYQVTPPLSPCKYCNAMHWHSQCEHRFPLSRTRQVYSARPRTTTVTNRASPHASPITLVMKRDKTKRFCVDYRKLNEIIAPNAHPLPLIETILDKLSKAKYYSSVDIASAYWQVEIKPNSQKFGRSCHTCQIIKRPKGKPYGALGQIPPPQQPFDLISIDTIDGFSKYGHSKTYLHIIVDYLTRYTWTFPSKSTSTLTYIQTLKIVLQQGSPKRLLSDRAPAFTSEKFRKFLITHGIQPLLTTSNNPQANGLMERLNATITGKLRLAYLENPKASWTQLVKRHPACLPPQEEGRENCFGNVLFFVENSDLVIALRPYGQVTSIIQKMMQLEDSCWADARREAYITLRDGVKISHIPARLDVKSKGVVTHFYVSYGIKCTLCHKQGHKRANCPRKTGVQEDKLVLPVEAPAVRTQGWTKPTSTSNTIPAAAPTSADHRPQQTSPTAAVETAPPPSRASNAQQAELIKEKKAGPGVEASLIQTHALQQLRPLNISCGIVCTHQADPSTASSPAAPSPGTNFPVRPFETPAPELPVPAPSTSQMPSRPEPYSTNTKPLVAPEEEIQAITKSSIHQRAKVAKSDVSSPRSAPQPRQITKNSLNSIKNSRQQQALRKARSATATYEQCYLIEWCSDFSPLHYIKALEEILGKGSVFQIMKISGQVLVGLASVDMAERLVEVGLNIANTLLKFPHTRRGQKMWRLDSKSISSLESWISHSREKRRWLTSPAVSNAANAIASAGQLPQKGHGGTFHLSGHLPAGSSAALTIHPVNALFETCRKFI
ncbi:hypothetical protein LAZ67_16001952 [Cordylochernes scorpioides]|uniref:Integrase catalytic domain-containing protein n=1 Tax=Cordylochernes scorpioides TaxID=51811 RepID=A0ABY6LBJ9_9ARAC|nr:hypothetical protein LAZ67_16001952 [Cordylochernes scorpioides]